MEWDACDNSKSCKERETGMIQNLEKCGWEKDEIEAAFNFISKFEEVKKPNI